jgi:hypothetical protein
VDRDSSPRVTKPITSSPGSGAQQRGKRTSTSGWPSTRMPEVLGLGGWRPNSPRRRCGSGVGVGVGSGAVSPVSCRTTSAEASRP